MKAESEPLRLEAHYFGLFDGHAGTGAALMASHSLHHHIKVLHFYLPQDTAVNSLASNTAQ